MAAHARLKNEFTEDEKYHNLMCWLINYQSTETQHQSTDTKHMYHTSLVTRTTQMRRLICAFVVRIWQKKGFLTTWLIPLLSSSSPLILML